MSPNSAAILANPDPSGHIVYPYTDEAHITNAVSLFAGAGLRNGDAVILVIANNHVRPVRQRLAAEGFNLERLEAAGQLVCRPAGDLLSTFMFDGIVDELKFEETIGRLIQDARRTSGPRRVRVFGEMVDLIWKAHPAATERLEQLWNRVVETHSVPLLCAYSLVDMQPGAFPETLLGCHSHSLT